LADLKKGQGEVPTKTGHVGPEGEQRYSSTFSLTSALDVGGWSGNKGLRYHHFFIFLETMRNMRNISQC